MTAWTAKPNIPQPRMGGMGDNYMGTGGDLASAIDPDLRGFSLDYMHCPHVDVDPNIGLMLLMGLTNRLTVRKELLSRDHPIDGKIDTQTPNLLLTDAIEQAQREGKTKLTIVLRFPNTHGNGKRFNKIHGTYNSGNCVSVPVIIDVSPEAIDEWKADALRTPINGNSSIKHAPSESDSLARKYGFADARAMQNSQPLALNNFWLNLNESRQKSRTILLAERQKERGKLRKEIEMERAEIERFEQKIAEPLPNEKEMNENAELAALAKEELDLLHAKKARLSKELEILRGKINDGSGSTKDEVHCADAKAVKQKSKEVRKNNDEIRKVLRLYDRSLILSPEYVERQREAWRTIIGYKQEKIVRLETLLDQCQTQIAELDPDSGNSQPKHIYAETDRNPNLMSLTVIAANQDDVIREIKTATREKQTESRHISAQSLYKRLYERALDYSPNGWLADALDTQRPENYYLRSTRRYFEMMYDKAKADGAKYESFRDFAADPGSSLGQAISFLKNHAVSVESRAAERKAASARG